MLTRRRLLAGASALGSTLAAGPGWTLERGTLFEVATRLVRIYQTGDAEAFHAMLAPDLRPGFPPAVLSGWLAEAREAFGMLQRVSLPTYGSVAHSIFVAYFDRRPCDMYLEIDRQERVVLWAFKNDVKVWAIRRQA